VAFAPNYGKTPYPENPKSQAFQIKDPIPVINRLIFI
jgi:hypothetical protein